MEMQFVAWFAAALVFVSFFVKTIIPLRTLAVASNIVYVGYAPIHCVSGDTERAVDSKGPVLVVPVPDSDHETTLATARS